MAVKTEAQLEAGYAASFPDNIAGSITAAALRAYMADLVDTMFAVGQKADLQATAVGYTSDLAVANGVAYFVVGPRLAGKTLNFVHAGVITAGVTGLTTIKVQRIRAGTTVSMMSTDITIDSAETGSDTAATPPVINGANADLALYDRIRIDITGISTTPPKGLIITLGTI